jgi:hypothetical protein
MSEWKEVSRAQAVTALEEGEHEVERECYDDGFADVGEWVDVNKHTEHWPPNRKYRIRRKQEYRDVRIPLGVKEAPEEDEVFFYLDAGSKNGYEYCPWGGIAWQLLHLERGLVYTDEAIVKQAVAAMGWGTE